MADNNGTPRKPRLVFVTQLVDPDDPVLGFAVGWMRALASRCDRLWVVANEVRAVPDDLDAEVVSLGKEKGAGKLGRGLRYEAALEKITRSHQVDGLIAHMCPIYLNLGAPVAKMRGVRTLLWFAHPADSKSLRVAGRLADVVLSSLDGAYPGPQDKVTYVGQGIDMDRYALAPQPSPGGPLRLLMLNRLSPVKKIPAVIEAVDAASRQGIDLTLRIVGPVTTAPERAHREELLALVSERGLDGIVSFEDGVSPARVPDVIATADVVVNATAGGSGDKTILESMAVGRPVILSNRVFAPLVADLPMHLTFDEGDVGSLTDRIVEAAGTTTEARAETGRALRDRVAAAHSLDRWADRVVALGGGPL